MTEDEDDDTNPFQREEVFSPVRDIETMEIEVDAKNAPKRLSAGLSGLREPEPEHIKSSDDEGSGRLSNFQTQ